MDRTLMLSPMDAQRIQTLDELRMCNDVTIRYGLYLSQQQMNNLVSERFESLRQTGRIEFGTGLLPMLILAFCDSPYIRQDNYEDTVVALLDVFYTVKNESMDLLSDDELIDFMKAQFDGECQGSMESLCDATLEGLCRRERYKG